jgi:hypothetical protein
LDIVLRLVRDVWPVLAREKVAQAEPLFATPAPEPQEPECEAAGGKSRTRRRGGKRRRAEAIESNPGTEELEAGRPVAQAGAEERATYAGEAGAGGEQADAAEEPSLPACAPLADVGLTGAAGVPRPGGAGEQLPTGPGAAADAGPRGERAGTATRTGAPGKGRRRGAEARPARGRVRDDREDSGVGVPPSDESGNARRDGGPSGVRKRPSTNRGDGAAPGSGASVTKRDNRPEPAAERGAPAGPSFRSLVPAGAS